MSQTPARRVFLALPISPLKDIAQQSRAQFVRKARALAKIAIAPGH